MLIRIRCKAGNFRYELDPSSTVSDLVSKMVESVSADPSSIALSNQPRGGEKRVNELRNRTLESLGLKHGDLLFVTYKDAVSEPADAPSVPAGEPTPATLRPPADATHRLWELAKEDPVDEYWRRQDGKIKRSRDPRLCKHGANAMCDHCMPLEPYDPAYHAEQGIKRLSYHAYLRKLSPSKPMASSASASLPPLDPLSYKVKVPCPKGNHAPWPAGICSSCQPSAITLQPQPFRMVDHLEFSTHEIVDRFLDVWRRTGTQRFGWLIGHYEPYDKVPMGIKAVVEAIHEPPQEGELDGLTLGLPWEEEGAIRALASAADPSLTFVGYIFTDLDPQEDDRTKMVYKRHPYSYYLSSLEVIFAARLQLQNPTASRSSTTGKFSSRLVTAVATGTEEGGIDINAYQISEQACAMVDADMIEASVDPGIVRVKEEDRTTGSARYIPDVFFRYKNEYGLDVQKSAKPCFPVEYLLIDVTHGFPQNPSPLFLSNKFPIENRLGVESQEVQKILRDLAKLRAPEVTSDPNFVRKEPGLFRQIVEYLSDWHLVAFLSTTGLISANDMKLLVRAASSAGSEDQQIFYELFRTSSWETLMTFTRENAPASQLDASNQQTISDEDMDELPQDIRDQIAAIEAQSTGVETGMGAGATSAPANVRVCPHYADARHFVCVLRIGVWRAVLLSIPSPFVARKETNTARDVCHHQQKLGLRASFPSLQAGTSTVPPRPFPYFLLPLPRICRALAIVFVTYTESARMRLDTMLAASTATPAPTSSTAPNDSSAPPALNGTSSARSHQNANADVKLDLDLDLEITSAAEQRIAESVSQELDYWEKLVFSFDMERDPGRSGQQPDAGSSSRTRGKRRTEEAQASGASSFIPGSAPSSSGTGQLHQQPSGTRQTHNPQFPPIATNPIIPVQQPNLQGQQLNQLPGLDPYTLAHLAALSALQQGQQGQGQQGQQPSNAQDPAVVLRQLQSLMYPYGHTGHTSPDRGSPMQGIAQGSPQLQHFPSGNFNRPGTQQHQLHPVQPSLSESSGQQQRWPPQVPSMGNLPFSMPPIDPALANQLSQLSQSFLPNAYAQQPSQIQTPGAGPSMGGMRARSRSTASSGGTSTPVSPSSSRGQTLVDDAAMSEDKRRRNTLASARFRIKKKHKTLALERSVVELEARADDLEREASELRRENGWLKEMLIMKGRSVRAQAAAVKAALNEAEEEEEEEEEEEASGEEGEDENNDGEKDEPDIKGKGKGKAT